MNRRRLLFIGFVALLLGGFVSTFVYRALQKRVAPEKEGVYVVIAARDLAVGQKLQDQDLRLVKYPADYLPSDVLRSASTVAGQWVGAAMVRGDFVTRNRISEGGSVVSLIPLGMRAEPVSVATPTARFAKPGYRVDVLVTGSDADGKKLQTMTLMQNILVMPASPQSEPSAFRDPNVVTLLVSPEDAQRLALANQTGRIQLIFRNPNDASQENRAPVQDIYAHDRRKPTRVRYSPPPPPTGYEIQLLRGDHREIFKVQ